MSGFGSVDLKSLEIDCLSAAESYVELYMCSAYKNKGVQLLLEGVTNNLPSPLDVTTTALVSHAHGPHFP